MAVLLLAIIGSLLFNYLPGKEEKVMQLSEIRSGAPLSKNIKIVLGNPSGDMDSVMSSIALAEGLAEGQGSKSDDYFALLNVPRADLNLRHDILYVFDQLKLDSSLFFFQEDLPVLLEQAKKGNVSFILVDQNTLEPHQAELAPFVSQIIDHHQQSAYAWPNSINKTIKKTGSTATLVLQELLRLNPNALNQQIAFLLLAPILLDTDDLKNASKTTELDIDAVEMLKVKAGQLFNPKLYATLLNKKRAFNFEKPNDILKKDFKTYMEDKLYYGISSLPYGVKWSVNNLSAWEEAVRIFVKDRNLNLWIGLGDEKDGKTLIFYSPNENLLQALMIYIPGNLGLNNELRISAFIPSENMLFYKLSNPLSRKELQPLLSLGSSPLIQSANSYP